MWEIVAKSHFEHSMKTHRVNESLKRVVVDFHLASHGLEVIPTQVIGFLVDNQVLMSIDPPNAKQSIEASC